MKRFVLFIGTAFGLGYFPVFPGTIGSVGGVLLFIVLKSFFVNSGIYYLNIFTLTALGAWVSKKIEIYLNQKDPGKIVIDEVIGQIITLSFVPVSRYYIIAGFVLFRLFDIFKPYPIRKLENIPNGWGIMLDDVLAGIYAGLSLFIINSAFFN